jgi:hypothetical protein
VRIRRHRLPVNPAETRRRALRAQLIGDAFAAVARVALDLRAAVPVEGEVGVDADAGWGGGGFDGVWGGDACPAGWVVQPFFAAAAGPGVGFVGGAGVALRGGPGCWVEEVVDWFLWGGEVGG